MIGIRKMEQLYYLNRERYNSGDVETAFRFALGLFKQDPNIDTITLLVPQARQYDIITKELGIATKFCTNHIVPNNLHIKLQVHTVKTYNPGYQFMGHEDCEVLIAVIVNPKDLEQFVDKSKVKYWIIVPWLMDENKSFLEVHEAVDLETGKAMEVDYELDDRVKHGIEWLKATSFPNSYFHHPNDEERLKQMSNALSHYKVPLTYDAVVNYCLNHGIINDAAHMIAEHFTKAQLRKFRLHNHCLAFMKQMMNRDDWD